MNMYRDRIINLAKETSARLIIPEIHDQRVEDARKELTSMGFQILNHENYREKTSFYIDFIKEKSFTKNWPIDNIKNYLDDPLHFSAAMLACDDADGVIAGANISSNEVIRTAIRIVGIQNESNWVSSIFFLVSPDGNYAYTFEDCAVIPEPDSKQLANIAGDSANFHYILTGEEARVAFLSFSTKGSAKHYRIDRVKEGVKIFKKKYPDILHDGELQLDTAIVPKISKIKAPDSVLAGTANVLIFPNLDAGNIAYKIAQRMGGYSAWGPLLQGLNKPIHDLSRGCSVDDIINIASIAALQKKTHAHI